jgi:acyl-CoA synthetase (AMP-forming)/AMP-acid ligase II
LRIERYLGLSAAAQPGKTALITDRRRLRYEELDDLSDRLATALAMNGVRRDDRVVIFMDNCWEAAVSVFAVLKAGAVFCLVNASTKTDKLAYIIADCEPAAVLTQARLMPVVSGALAGRDGVFVACAHGPDEDAPVGATSLPECLAAAARPPAHGGIDFDLAMLVYTSGSTGRPKG